MKQFAVTLLMAALLSACGTPGGQVAPHDADVSSPQGDIARRAAIRLQLAASYLEAGQFSVALDEVNKVLALDSSLADAYHIRALAYMNLREEKLAEDNFRRALSAKPQDGDLLSNYGWFMCGAGRYPEAIAMLDRAIGAPSAGGVIKPMINLGLCYLRQGDSSNAERTLLRAHYLDERNPVANANLAAMYYKRGDAGTARPFIMRVNDDTRFANAESLWLGARIAHRLDDRRLQDAFTEQLRRRFPDSRELAAFERGAWDE
jgi:type IV pilus assembly protein PilF